MSVYSDFGVLQNADPVYALSGLRDEIIPIVTIPDLISVVTLVPVFIACLVTEWSLRAISRQIRYVPQKGDLCNNVKETVIDLSIMRIVGVRRTDLMIVVGKHRIAYDGLPNSYMYDDSDLYECIMRHGIVVAKGCDLVRICNE